MAVDALAPAPPAVGRRRSERSDEAAGSGVEGDVDDTLGLAEPVVRGHVRVAVLPEIS